MREDEEQDPEHKERRFRLDDGFEIGPELTWSWQKCEKQKQHAKQPSDRLPEISPGRFAVVRRASPGADN